MRYALFRISVVSLLTLLAFMPAVGQSFAVDPASKLLPDRIADFKAAGAAATPKAEDLPATTGGITSIAARPYVSKDGKKLRLTIATAQSNSAAYAVLAGARRATENVGKVDRADVGTAGFQQGGRIVFVKGPSLVAISPEDASQGTATSSLEIARAYADTLNKGEGDIPVLIKHLPNWESVRDRVLYAIDKETLRSAVSNQPILEALNFDGGAEAAVADYNGPKMVLVEFNTPQIASDNDQRIAARLAELGNQGQPVPAAYRRVGNYAVFVFDAPTQEAANQLIDQVKYQQMVQWLGENPYRYDQAVREFAETTLGVFVNVVKASGLVILGSLALGGLLGAVLFSRRRAQQRAVDAYSDAGGMLRLNLNETPPKNSRRLLGPGN